VTGVLTAAGPARVVADDLLSAAAAEASERAGLGAVVGRMPEAQALTGHAAPRRRPAELALLQFTSGSSGQPKGVRVTGENLGSNICGIRQWIDWTADEAGATWLPLYHDMGLIGALLTPVAHQFDLWVMTPDQFLREPLRWLECFGRNGVAITTAPSFGYGYTARRVRPADVADMACGWRSPGPSGSIRARQPGSPNCSPRAGSGPRRSCPPTGWPRPRSP
jgi:acyl-CoA synthetase (AMP-forming)/AMP-acid ligase II